MLREFRQSYPTGSLISDLLGIHEGKYLVRVIVRVDGQPIATGLAAEEKLELAEDRARERAMEALGISPARVLTEKTVRQKSATISPGTEEVYLPRPTSTQPSSTFSHGNQTSKATPPITEMERGGLTPVTEISRAPATSSKDWSSERSAMPSWEADDSFSAPESARKTNWDDDESFSATKPASQQEDLSTASATDSQASTHEIPFPSQLDYPGADANESAFSHQSAEELDNSDILAQTDVQMKRLGWDARKGRAILSELYNVASRRLLNSEQLLDFLHYLKNQPDP